MTTILSSREVVTRKEHQCSGCARKMPEATPMKTVTYKDGRTLCSSYWCKTCQVYWNKYMRYDDEIGIGDLRHEDRENWEYIRNQIEGEVQ